MTASCLYRGTLTHLRLAPERVFSHRVAMAYIDLDELPALLDGRLLRRRPGLMRFRRSDYHGDPALGLADAVRSTVERETGVRPPGPVRVLANLRSLGHCFNPVCFYYCFDRAGEQLQAVVAEVTNTPWGERHAYVISGGAGRFEKRLHVSPFMPMDQSYLCRTTAPGERVAVTIESRHGDQRAFAASLLMDRLELTPAAVRRVTARYPFATVRTLALIYGHALGLALAGVRHHPHPQGGVT